MCGTQPSMLYHSPGSASNVAHGLRQRGSLFCSAFPSLALIILAPLNWWCHRVLLPDGSVAPLTPTLRKAVLSQVEAMAEKALRCLALAQKVRTSHLHTPAGP